MGGRSKARVCGRRLAGDAGSNPDGGIYAYVCFVSKENNVTFRRVRESLLHGEARNITYWSVRACVHMGTRARGRVHAHKCM